MKDGDGGPAFPAHVDGQRGWIQVGPSTFGMPGMSLRDYFAGQAIAGLAANPKNDEMIRGIAHWPATASAWAYRVADALLDERARGRKS